LIQRFYIHCETPKEELHIKIKAESDEEALSLLHEQYKVQRVIGVKTKQPMVKYEKASNAYQRSMYPYIKNDNGKSICIFT
jgi:hypothetical protein